MTRKQGDKMKIKKLLAIITGALLAGAVSAQGTVELTSAQMDQVTAGSAAADAIAAGAFASVGGVTTIADVISAAAVDTVNVPGFSSGFAASANQTVVFTFGGSNAAASASQSAVLITP
jgi:hypothetical protein